MGNTSTSCYIHRWSIAHFSWYFPNGRLNWKEYIESRVIKPENSKLAFYLRLYPRGKEDDNGDYASLEFGCLESGLLRNLKLKLTFVIEDKRRQKRSKIIAYQNFDQNDVFVCTQLIRLAELDQERENLLPKDTLTICCSIQERENSNLIQGFAQGNSVSEPDLLSQFWTIHNFTDYLSGGKMSWKKVLTSKSFSTLSGYEFYLSLYPNGIGKGNDYLSIFLHSNLSEENKHVMFSWTHFLVDEFGTRCNIQTFENYEGRNVGWHIKEGFGQNCFISHDDLLKQQKKYLPQNKLTICVDIGDLGNKLIRDFTQRYTCTKINALSHIWTIEDFTEYLAGGKMHCKDRLYSEVLSTKDGNYQFNLGLCPCGFNDETRNNVTIYLYQKKGENIKFNFVLSIIDADGKRTNIQDFACDLNVPCYFPKYISHHDLFNPQNNYLSQNKLTIVY